MSNLSELLPAGAGAKSAEFVASGTLASGQTVILQSDGTVKAIGTTPAGFGSSAVFESFSTSYSVVVYDSYNDKLVVFYADDGDSNKGKAAVGTVTGNSISWGTPVQFSNGNDVSYIGATYDPDTYKAIVVYKDGGNSNYGTANVGTVSGTSISFGTRVVYESASVFWNAATYDTAADKVVIAYRDSGNGNKGTAIVGTVSGTAISFGSAVEIDGGESNRIGITFDTTNNKVIIVYQGSGIEIISGTVSGTSISFGSSTQLTSSGTNNYIGIAYNPTDDRFLVAFHASSASGILTLQAGNTSGSGFAVGSAVTVSGTNASYPSIAYDSSAGIFNVAYQDQNNSSKGYVVPVTVSGTAVSASTAQVFGLAANDFIWAAYNSSAKNTAIVYKDQNNSSYGTGIIWANIGTNSADFIGITDQAIADTATGAVIVQGGVSEKLSGLTVGADYYVQNDGSLASPTAPFPYVIDGATFIQSFSVSAQETEPQDLFIKPDGTEIYISGGTGQGVDQYTLSTAYDLSTASYTAFYSTSAQGANPRGLFFSSDGTKMFECQASTQDIKQYTLSTAWDITTASFDSVNFVISGQVTGSRGVCFNQAGTRMYAVGSVTSVVAQYDLGTAWNISTAVYNSVSFNFSAQASGAESVFISSDGLTMLVGGSALFKYTLSSAFDVSSAVYSESFDAGSGDFVGVNFSSDGTKLYYIQYSGTQADKIQEYSSGVGSATSVPAGRALSSTSILLEG
jgi:hypothetical protein